MLKYPIVVYEPKIFTVYVHTVPKEIRSSTERDDYYDKYYVGITRQKITRRWGLKGERYKGQLFSQIINKYGWDNIRHYIIKENLSESDAKVYERLLIYSLKSFVTFKHGYNRTTGGDAVAKNNGLQNSFYNKHHTQETKQIISKKARERKPLMRELYGQRICQFTLDGEYVTTYLNTLEAEEKTKIDHSVIARVLNGKLNYTHGYYWKRLNEIENMEDVKDEISQKLIDKSKKYGRHLSKAVYRLDVNFNIIEEYESAAEAAKQNGKHADTIAYAARNQSLSCGSYWIYKNDYEQRCLNDFQRK